jgi:hypothetical protein
MPERIQRKRTQGWKMPPNTVSVTRPGKWGNPHLVSKLGQEEAVRAFERDLRAGALPYSIEDVKRELRGKNLACYCALDQSCHADVLLEFANKG